MRHDSTSSAGFSSLVGYALAEGVHAIGVFVGFNQHQESCWEYYRVSSESVDGYPKIETLPENERPV